MAKNYNKMAIDIVREIGGEENVASLAHCMTRLRFVVKDENKVNLDALKKVEGVIQVMIAAGQYQVVIGTDVGDVYDEIGKTSNINLSGDVEEDGAPAAKKSPLTVAIDVISGIFLLFMGAFMAAGLLKGFLVVFTTLGWLSTDGTTYQILYAIADGVFNFLPIFIAYTAGKKFKADPFVSMAIAAALVYPNISTLYSAGEAVHFLGIPVTLISYPCSVIPIVVAVFVQSKLEKGLKKIFPQVIRGIFVPLISLVVVALLTFLVIGPVTNLVAVGLADGIKFLLDVCPPVAGFVFGAIYPIMLIFGLHWGLVPIVMNNFATVGADPVMAITLATNFALAGCAFGVFLKSKNQQMKQTAVSTGISALVAGVTEPAIYGVVLKFKKPFVIVCILDAIGGMLIATVGATQTAIISTCVLTIPAFVAMMGIIAAIVAAIGFFGGLILTFLFGYNDKMLEA